MITKQMKTRVNPFRIILFIIATLNLTMGLHAETAELPPSLHIAPYHKVKLKGDVKRSTGAAYVNFQSRYTDSLSGDPIIISYQNNTDSDKVVLCQQLDSSLNLKTEDSANPAIVVFRVDTTGNRPIRHATSLYISAMAFNVTNKFLDPVYAHYRPDSTLAMITVL